MELHVLQRLQLNTINLFKTASKKLLILGGLLVDCMPGTSRLLGVHTASILEIAPSALLFGCHSSSLLLLLLSVARDGRVHSPIRGSEVSVTSFRCAALNPVSPVRLCCWSEEQASVAVLMDEARNLLDASGQAWMITGSADKCKAPAKMPRPCGTKKSHSWLKPREYSRSGCAGWNISRPRMCGSSGPHFES